ncbi:hypothetical protein GGX14DRAFT_571576 [Mycena pura]|uniref:Uncharacterized protein n=1 Tax=Mycena pura TaxID=153505 RepID=A0AAD6V638_9AGAR|nr:hypothetical protein GGX14DRAFT_571576 [Mycena pura]
MPRVVARALALGEVFCAGVRVLMLSYPCARLHRGNNGVVHARRCRCRCARAGAPCGSCLPTVQELRRPRQADARQQCVPSCVVSAADPQWVLRAAACALRLVDDDGVELHVPRARRRCKRVHTRAEDLTQRQGSSSRRTTS